MTTGNRHFPEKLIGFLIPLGIFLERGSPILLARSNLVQEDFALPISMLVLPFAFYLGVSRRTPFAVFPKWLSWLAIAFSTYCIVMSSVISGYFGSSAFLYGIQWCLLFFWFPYFSSITDAGKFFALVNGFCKGAIFNIFYYFISGAGELLLYGSLQGGGRMSQNLILPGQYQIAVYIPTLVAYSGIMVDLFYWSGIYKAKRAWIILVNAAMVLDFVFLGAREPLLIVAVFLILYYIIKGGWRRWVGILGTAVVALLAAKPSLLQMAFAGSHFRLFEKLARVDQAGRYYGGRDKMLEDVSSVLRESPIFGTYFNPPNGGMFANVSAPSAHNMYVDAFVWAGLFGGTLYLLISVGFISIAAKGIWKSILSLRGAKFQSYFCAGLLTFLLVSNNLNVPMRQPVIAPLLVMLLYCCLDSAVPNLMVRRNAKN